MKRYILKEMRDFGTALKKINFERFNIKMPNMSLSRIMIMGYLCENKDHNITQKELEKNLQVKAATISGLIDLMEKDGLIKRTSSKEDGRKKYIELNTFDNSMLKKLDKVNSFIEKNISESDLDTFYRVLDQMKENMKEENNE